MQTDNYVNGVSKSLIVKISGYLWTDCNLYGFVLQLEFRVKFL